MITGGQHPGEVTLLSGVAGLGKSILAVQMAMGMSKHSPGVIYEMEMGETQTVRRSVSNESRIDNRRLRNGKIGGDWDVLTKAISALENLPIYISDSTSWTTASLRADLARLKALYGIQWFVVDYLGLLQDSFGTAKEYEREGYISKSLKAICKDLDLAGIVIHTMTKAEMGSDQPSLAGMRGSALIGYDADIVVYLLEDEVDKEAVQLFFVKFREDVPDRYIRLKKDAGFPAFKDIVDERTFRSPYKD